MIIFQERTQLNFKSGNIAQKTNHVPSLAGTKRRSMEMFLKIPSDNSIYCTSNQIYTNHIPKKVISANNH